MADPIEFLRDHIKTLEAHAERDRDLDAHFAELKADLIDAIHEAVEEAVGKQLADVVASNRWTARRMEEMMQLIIELAATRGLKVASKSLPDEKADDDRLRSYLEEAMMQDEYFDDR
jgi:hypothetical protein